LPSIGKFRFFIYISMLWTRGPAIVGRASFTGALNLSEPSPRLPEGHPPLLLVVIDTEEEFDWSRPHARENTSVTAIAAQQLAQEIFANHAITPTYVIDYPVASSPAAVAALRVFADRGHCRIGAHLHPWVNPPYTEPVNAYNSYPGNLPISLEREKLEILTAAITQGFGTRPVVYKAGRYGIGTATAQILEELGYLIDVSVVPYTSFAADGGPDFSAAGFHPSWFGSNGNLLEIPLSCGFYGFLRALGPTLFPHLSGAKGMRLRLPGIFARSGLLERIRLTPEGVDLAANIRLARSLYDQGCRVFSFTYHSPSLVPGMTPYVRSERQLSQFLRSMDRFFSFFGKELGGRPSEPLEVYNLLRQHARSTEPADDLRMRQCS
jgi:hypothetical protein